MEMSEEGGGWLRPGVSEYEDQPISGASEDVAEPVGGMSDSAEMGGWARPGAVLELAEQNLGSKEAVKRSARMINRRRGLLRKRKYSTPINR